MIVDRLIKYYYKKEKIRLIKMFSSSKMLNKTILTNADENISKYEGCFFYFDNMHLMHLGDQAYFKPLIKKLIENNIKVIIKPTKIMKFFFPCDTINTDDLSNWLFVGRTDMLLDIKGKFGNKINYFLFDTNSSKINNAISNFIVDAFFSFFKLEKNHLTIQPSDYVDYNVDITKYEYLKKYDKIVILNNYVDSGIHRIIGLNNLLLKHLSINKHDATVIHLGSLKDKEKDSRNYQNIVDIDLRGKTSIEDLFSIMALPNIICVYTYDTFAMHVANFYNKKIHVACKRYFKIGENAQKRKAFSSLFEKDKSNITYLN